MEHPREQVRARVEYGRALFCARRALRLDPEHVLARCNLATALRRRGRPTEAIAECQEELQRRPGERNLRRTLAWCLLDLGRHAEARDLAAQLVAGDARDERAHHVLAVAYARLGDWPDAADHAGRAYDLSKTAKYRQMARRYRENVSAKEPRAMDAEDDAD